MVRWLLGKADAVGEAVLIAAVLSPAWFPVWLKVML